MPNSVAVAVEVVVGVPGGEADVGGRAAAAGDGAVHDVVVDQGAGVHELEGGDGAQHGGVVLAAPGPASRAPRQPQ